MLVGCVKLCKTSRSTKKLNPALVQEPGSRLGGFSLGQLIVQEILKFSEDVFVYRGFARDLVLSEDALHRNTVSVVPLQYHVQSAVGSVVKEAQLQLFHEDIPRTVLLGDSSHFYGRPTERYHLLGLSVTV